jgi:hypothetical protein
VNLIYHRHGEGGAKYDLRSVAPDHAALRFELKPTPLAVGLRLTV